MRNLASAAALLLLFTATPAGAATIFSETFEGYSSFPIESPSGIYVNEGRPITSEGSDEDWIGARFEAGAGLIEFDLAVQEFGGGTNNTHVGRFEDNAGLVAKLDLTLFESALLSFDWRTFSTQSNDRFVVAYFIGDTLGATDADHDWFNDPSLGDSQTVSGGAPPCPDFSDCNPWVANNWTELLRVGEESTWTPESFSLPAGDVLYLAFWMDDGEKDHGMIDNIVVTGGFIPEPSTAVLVMLGLVGLAAHGRPRKA